MTNCFSLGGKICEIESETENNLIKAQLQTKITGGKKYTVKPVLRGHLWDKEKVTL
jgi:hypothetical protein